MSAVEAPARKPIGFPFGFAVGIILGVYLALLASTFRGSLNSLVPKTIASPPPIATPDATGMPAERTVSLTKETLNVYLGPGSAYGVIGTLPKEAALDVRWGERSGSWLAIYFPPNSSGRGWVLADRIELVLRREEPDESATLRPERVSETLSSSTETDANSQTSTPPSLLGRRDLVVLTGVTAAVMALVAGGFVWRQRASRVQLVGLGDARPEVGVYPVMSQQMETKQAGRAVEPAAEPFEGKENALNQEIGQESSQSKASPDEVLRRGLGEFSQTLQGITTSVCSALEKLGADFREAFGSIAEEQRAVLQRQEALLEETQRATNEARTHAEQASLAASQTASNQDRAAELLANLQKDRDGLSVLVGDLRSRIAALSILAAPLPEANQGQLEAVPIPAGGEQHSEWSQ